MHKNVNCTTNIVAHIATAEGAARKQGPDWTSIIFAVGSSVLIPNEIEPHSRRSHLWSPRGELDRFAMLQNSSVGNGC